MVSKPTYEELEQRVNALEKMNAELKRVGEMTVKKEYRYRTLFEAANDSIFILEDYRFVECNKMTLKMFGCEDKREIIGFYPWNFSPSLQPDGRVSKEKAIEMMEAASGGKPQQFYWKHVKKDGSEFDAEVSLNCLEAGSTNSLQAIVRDVTHRKKAEEALLESETRMKSIFRAAPIGIGVVSNRVIMEVNDRLCEIIGYSRDELIGKNARVLYPTDEDYEYVGREKYKKIKEWGTGTVETRLKCKNGKIIDVLLSSTPFDPSDFSAGVTFTALDITERKKAEEALRESEERFRGVVEDTPVLICRFLPGGKITFVNTAYCEYFGKSSEELVGSTFLSLIPEAAQKNVMNNISSLTVQSPTQTHEHPVIVPNGDIRWQRWTNRALFDAQGKIVGYQSIGEDITEWKWAEEAIRESQERFKELAELLPETIYEMDTAGNLTFVNRIAFEQFGYTQQDLDSGLNALDMIIPEHRSKAMGSISKILRGDNLGLQEYTALKKNGTTFPALFRSVAIVRKGVPEGMRGFIIDITEKKHLEKQVKQAQKMEAIGTLAGGIAHDFNNILSPIIGNAELAMMDVDDNSHIKLNLKEILKAGFRAKDLVQQILTFSRQKDQEKIPVRMSINIKEISKLLRSTIPTTIDIRYNLNAKVDTVLADPTQIHQVIMNLCTNASHAMREKGGVLEIELDDLYLDSNTTYEFKDLNPGAYLRLTVKDSGYGIKPETIDKIFEPYFTTKEFGEGTGLGLAVVHGIINSLGGDICVESTPGKGSSFKVLFPKYESYFIEDKEDTDMVPLGTEHILLVDDEKATIDVTKAMLKRLGYKVTARTSGIDALEAFRYQPDKFDLVITDMTMPNMTGKELVKELISIRSIIPIILCTGFSEQIDNTRTDEMGISALVMKPILMSEIANTVRQVLDKK